MGLSEYFESVEGLGVLATSDSEGNVDAAIYARPHFMEGGEAAFIMAERLSYSNVQSNPKAVYMFVEIGGGYKGKRLYLSKTGESDDAKLIESLRRKRKLKGSKKSHLVYFRVDKERPLVGG